MKQVSQRGTALFVILIAVALFAALGYAISQSNRDSGGVDREKLSLSVARATQYMGQVGQAINRLRLINKCTDYQFSFDNTIVSGYANASAPADKSCHVFDPAGAGMSFLKPPSGLNDGSDWFYRAIRIYGVGVDQTFCTDGVGMPPCYELVMFMRNVTQDACREFNKRMLNTTVIYAQDNGKDFELSKFAGSYAGNSDIEYNGPGTDGKNSSCTQAADGEYYIYYVLLAR